MRVQYLLLGLLCVFAFGLRIINIGQHGIAGDEKTSFFVSQFIALGGVNQEDIFKKPNNPYFTPQEFWKKKTKDDFYVAEARSDNGSSALYALTLHYWTQLFGVDDGTLRGLSAFFGVLLVALIYFFVLDYFQSTHLALATAALASVEPLYVGWSQVVRTYSMTFFFCLLATWLFFRLLELEKNKQKPTGLYAVYGVCVFACLMFHYSVFVLFVLHGLLVLLFVRQWRAWVGLGLAMVIPALGMCWWLFFSEGGKYAFRFMADSARVYNLMAAKDPQIGYLAPTAAFSVFVQMLPVVANHYLPTNGFFDALLGKKNLLIALFGTVSSVGIYASVLNEKIKKGAIAGIFLVAFLLYSESKLQFTGLSVALVLLLMLVQDTFQQRGQLKHKYLSMWILSIFPLLFLVAFAIQDGNTFRIQQKYAGYGMAFSLILVVLAVRKMWTYPNWVKYPMTLLLIIQLGFVGKTIQSIWADTAPRYLLFSTPRLPNPYRAVAQQIIKKCTPTDTIVYPSYLGEGVIYAVDAPQYSLNDAQLVNFYLPPTAQYWQRINPAESNKIYLKRANGTQELLFDFKGTTYRY